MRALDWEEQVVKGANSKFTKFSVNLDGVVGTTEEIFIRGKNFERRNFAIEVGGRRPSSFDWEMYTLNRLGALDRTDFYRNGQIVPNPFK